MTLEVGRFATAIDPMLVDVSDHRGQMGFWEIKGLIEDSVRRVEHGSALASESGRTLDAIVRSVKKVSDLVAAIDLAGREQSTGIEHVNKAVIEMDQVTQQNAALVEEITAASQTVSEQAQTLNAMMARYRVHRSEGLRHYLRTGLREHRAAISRRHSNRVRLRGAVTPSAVRVVVRRRNRRLTVQNRPGRSLNTGRIVERVSRIQGPVKGLWSRDRSAIHQDRQSTGLDVTVTAVGGAPYSRRIVSLSPAE